MYFIDCKKIFKTILEKVFFFFWAVSSLVGGCVQKFEKWPF
jgi:hypothetical protein